MNKKIIYYVRLIYGKLFGFGFKQHFTEYCKKGHRDYFSDYDFNLEMFVCEQNQVILYNENIHIYCSLISGAEYTVKTQIKQNMNYELKFQDDGIELFNVLYFIDKNQNELKSYKPCLTKDDIKLDIYIHFSILHRYCRDFIDGNLKKWQQLNEYNKICIVRNLEPLIKIDELLANEMANRELMYTEFLKLYESKRFNEVKYRIEMIKRKTNHLTDKEERLLVKAKDHAKYRWLE